MPTLMDQVEGFVRALAELDCPGALIRTADRLVSRQGIPLDDHEERKPLHSLTTLERDQLLKLVQAALKDRNRIVRKTPYLTDALSRLPPSMREAAKARVEEGATGWDPSLCRPVDTLGAVYQPHLGIGAPAPLEIQSGMPKDCAAELQIKRARRFLRLLDVMECEFEDWIPCPQISQFEVYDGTSLGLAVWVSLLQRKGWLQPQPHVLFAAELNDDDNQAAELDSPLAKFSVIPVGGEAAKIAAAYEDAGVRIAVLGAPRPGEQDKRDSQMRMLERWGPKVLGPEALDDSQADGVCVISISTLEDFLRVPKNGSMA